MPRDPASAKKRKLRATKTPNKRRRKNLEGDETPNVHRSDVSSLTISYDKMQTKYKPALIRQQGWALPKTILDRGYALPSRSRCDPRLPDRASLPPVGPPRWGGTLRDLTALSRRTRGVSRARFPGVPVTKRRGKVSRTRSLLRPLLGFAPSPRAPLSSIYTAFFSFDTPLKISCARHSEKSGRDVFLFHSKR